MIIARIDGTTRELGKSQGFRGLPIRDQQTEYVFDLAGKLVDATTPVGAGFQVCRVPEMVSAWEPTPAELARLNAGAKVLLTVQGAEHPPVKVEVGAAPDLAVTG